MTFIEPISNRHCHSQAEADALHAEIVRRQNILLRSNHDRLDAERAELFSSGVGAFPVDEPKTYPRVHRDGVSIAEPPSISVIPANHVAKRRRKFLFW